MLFQARRLILPVTLCLAVFLALTINGVAQDKPKDTAETPAKQKTEPQQVPAKPNEGALTAEQVAELVIYFHGSRPILQQIRRTGLEHGRITRTNADGRTEEATYDLRFVRGDSADKDRLWLDQQMPTIEYSIIYDTGKVFGLLKGSVFTPRQEATSDLLSQSQRGVEALLRYKENGSTLTLKGKEKQQNIDLYVLDLTDKMQRTTRYYISAKLFRVLWVEYDEPGPNGTKVAYKRRYYDYRYAQSTLVPYRSVLYRDGQQISETQILTVTYGGKVDNEVFQNPEQASTNPLP